MGMQKQNKPSGLPGAEPTFLECKEIIAKKYDYESWSQLEDWLDDNAKDRTIVSHVLEAIELYKKETNWDGL